MFNVGDRVSEKGQQGIITAIHTPGTVDVLFDGEEYAIRRQEHDVKKLRTNPSRLRLVKPKKKSKRVKKLTKSMRDRLPKSDFIFPKRRSFPIPDIGHGRLAIQYGQFPNNRKDLSKIKKAVFKRYPSLIKWWNKNHPEDKWRGVTRETSRKMVANPSQWKITTKNENGRVLYVVTGRTNKGPKKFYTKKNALEYLKRRREDR